MFRFSPSAVRLSAAKTANNAKKNFNFPRFFAATTNQFLIKNRFFSFASGAFCSGVAFFSFAPLYCSTLALCSSNATSAQQYTEQADKHHNADQVADSFRVTSQAVAEHPDNIEVLWRFGRAQYLMSKEQTGSGADQKKAKETFVRNAVDTLNKCLTIDSENWAANKWMGMALGALGEFVPLKEKIGNSFKIKDNFQKAIAGNPNDATSFHCMGAWCWNILQVSGVERSLASWIFATPPSTTFEECEDNLLRSHKIDSTQIHNSLLLGDLYQWKSNKDEAAKWFYHAARECPVNTAYQRDYVVQAEKKLVGLLGEKWEEKMKK